MTEIYVRTDTQFKDAIKNAQPGYTIYLAPGDYAPITIKSAQLDITITSLDPENPAVMTGLTLRDSSGVTFSNVKMAAPLGTHNAFTVVGSSDVSFDSIEMYGPDNLGSGKEVSPFIIRSSENVSVTNSEFYNVKHAIQLLDVEQVTVDGNSFHHIRTDGVRGGGISNSQISNNNFTDFFPAENDHADAIQLWSAQQTKSAENILVTGNVIVRGAGDPIQGIFIRDNDNELPFKNVTVTDNVVLGGNYHGVSVNGVTGGTVTGNLVAGYEDQPSWIRVINEDDTDVSGNTSTRYVFDTRDSAYHDANQSIPATGVDYASVVPDDIGSGFVTLRPTDIMGKVAQLTEQEQPSQPEPPVAETPQPEEPVDTPPGDGGSTDTPPGASEPEEETPAPETPPSGETPPQTSPEDKDDDGGPPPPPPLTGEGPGDGGHEGRAVYASNDAQLKDAIKNAQPGDTIYLSAGSYAPITIKSAQLDITITSLDPENPAVMTGLTLRDSSGVAFSNVKMAAPLGTHNAFTVVGSSDVSFDSIEMYGLGGMGSGKEVSPFIIRSSENVSVTNSQFHDVNHAVQLLDVEQVTVSGNSFHDVKGGAVRGGGVSNTQITDNHFSDFQPNGGSASAIQFWTTQQTKSAENILVSGNVIERGDGEMVQGIFIADQAGDLPFKNVVVTDNIVMGGAYNAIMINGVEGGQITGNIVAGYEDQRSWIRVINDHDTDISGNTATHYVFETRDSLHHGTNQTIPEKGMDYSAITPAALAEMVAAKGGGAAAPAAQALQEINGSGQAGPDYFLFRDGDLGNRSLDMITDFQSGLDEGIHLRGVDADSNTAWDENFTVSGKVSELNYTRTDEGIMVGGDLNDDGVADFGILLKGLSSISATDFLL